MSINTFFPTNNESGSQISKNGMHFGALKTSGIKVGEGLEDKLKRTKKVGKIQYQVKWPNCWFWFDCKSTGKFKQKERKTKEGRKKERGEGGGRKEGRKKRRECMVRIHCESNIVIKK